MSGRGRRGAEPQKHFTQVPNDLLFRSDVCHVAKVMWQMAWALPEWCGFRLVDLDRQLGIGRELAQKCRAQLEAAGYLVRDPGGAGGGFAAEFVWPDHASSFKLGAVWSENLRESEKPTVAKSGEVGAENPQPEPVVSVSVEGLSPPLKTNTPAAGAAPQARRRRPPGKAAAISPAPEPVELVEPGELVELGERVELGDHGPIADRSEAVASEVPPGAEARAPWRVASSPASAISPRPDPVPEVLDYLASRDRPYFLQR